MLTFPLKLFLDSPQIWQISVSFNVQDGGRVLVPKIVSSFALQNTPALQANWQHVTKTTSFGALNRAWRNGTKVGQLFIFIFLNKCRFKNANVALQPAAHTLSRPAPGAILDTFPCGVNVFLFSTVLSFYWVLIISGRLDGRLDFLLTVYWEIKTNNIVNFWGYESQSEKKCKIAWSVNMGIKQKCPCISQNEVNVIKYIGETGRRLGRPDRFMEHYPSKQISPLAAILLRRATKQTGKVTSLILALI